MATVSEYLSPIKKILPNPAVAALATGGLLYGATRMGYPLVVGGTKHLASMFGMKSPAEHQEIEQSMQRPGTKTWLPAVLGLLGAGGVLASSYNASPAMKWGGLLDSWDDPRRAVSTEAIGRALTEASKAYRAKNSSNTDDMSKTGSFDFNWDINDQTSMDFGKMLPVRMTKDIIMNDPSSEIYQKGNALDIINTASNNNDDGRMSAGSLFDSALNKVQRNLTLGGVAEAGIRSLIGYGMAKAFTNTMCHLVDMPKPVRDGIVSAGMITNVIQGLD